MIGFEADSDADADADADTDADTVTVQGGTWRIIMEVFGKR